MRLWNLRPDSQNLPASQRVGPHNPGQCHAVAVRVSGSAAVQPEDVQKTVQLFRAILWVILRKKIANLSERGGFFVPLQLFLPKLVLILKLL